MASRSLEYYHFPQFWTGCARPWTNGDFGSWTAPVGHGGQWKETPFVQVPKSQDSAYPAFKLSFVRR